MRLDVTIIDAKKLTAYVVPFHDFDSNGSGRSLHRPTRFQNIIVGFVVDNLVQTMVESAHDHI